MCESSFRRRLHVGRLDHDRSTVASHACSSSSAWQERGKCVLVRRACRVSPQTCGPVPTSSGRTDIVALLEQTKQVCQCTLRSVMGKGDTEEQARKNAEELMTNVAKNSRQVRSGAVTSSPSGTICSKLVDGRRRRSRSGPVKLPMTLLTQLRKKVRPARR